MLYFFLFIIIGGCIIALIYIFIKPGKNNLNNQEPKKQEVSRAVKDSYIQKARQEANIPKPKSPWERTKERYYNWLSNTKEKYGTPDVCLELKSYEADFTLLVYKNDSFIIYDRRQIPFSNILMYEIKENNKVIKGKTTMVSKANIWDEIKRESMTRSFGKTTGTFLAGPVRNTTEVKTTPDKIITSYEIKVTLNDFNHPYIEFPIKSADEMKRISSILDIIIQHNKLNLT